MKQFIACALSLSLAFGMVTPWAAAAELTPADREIQVIALADGGYLTIAKEEFTALVNGIKSGIATYTKSDTNGNIVWTATLSADFTYNGTTATCTSAGLGISSSDSHYYEVSRSVNKSGNTATANFTIGYKLLGVTYNTESYTITLSCDKDGNLS